MSGASNSSHLSLDEKCQSSRQARARAKAFSTAFSAGLPPVAAGKFFLRMSVSALNDSTLRILLVLDYPIKNVKENSTAGAAGVRCGCGMRRPSDRDQ